MRALVYPVMLANGDRRVMWSRIWVRLSIGFGLLLILISISTVGTLRETFRNSERLADAYDKHYRIADALTRLRSDLYLAGILKRDFLLDPAPSHGSYGEEFDGIKESTSDHLKTLQILLSPEQADSLERLRAEVESYMRPLDQALNWEPLATVAMRWQLLRQQLRQRASALQMASDIEQINSRNLAIQQDKIRLADVQFRRFLLLTTGGALLLAVLIAGVTVWHMRRLERQSERAKSELRELSHQVVKVQEQERKTISRELHDEVGQLLTGLRMELGSLDGPHARQDPAYYQRLLETKSLAERALRTVRDLAMILRPSMLDDLGLSPALHWQAREFTRRTDVPVNISITGDVDTLGDELRTCVYRVVQEALTNAERHAHAKSIEVTIQRNAGSVSAVIQDDGVGFDRTVLRQHGLGLLGIEERVRELSGRVEIISQPTSGTRIVIQLPARERVDELSGVGRG